MLFCIKERQKPYDNVQTSYHLIGIFNSKRQVIKTVNYLNSESNPISKYYEYVWNVLLHLKHVSSI